MKLSQNVLKKMFLAVIAAWIALFVLFISTPEGGIVRYFAVAFVIIIPAAAVYFQVKEDK